MYPIGWTRQKEDGSFRLNLDYFDFQYGRAMTNDRFAELFGGARRMPESRITKREMDIAASAQKVVEDVILRLVRYAKEKQQKHHRGSPVRGYAGKIKHED